MAKKSNEKTPKKTAKNRTPTIKSIAKAWNALGITKEEVQETEALMYSIVDHPKGFDPEAVEGARAFVAERRAKGLPRIYPPLPEGDPGEELDAAWEEYDWVFEHQLLHPSESTSSDRTLAAERVLKEPELFSRKVVAAAKNQLKRK